MIYKRSNLFTVSVYKKGTNNRHVNESENENVKQLTVALRTALAGHGSRIDAA